MMHDAQHTMGIVTPAMGSVTGVKRTGFSEMHIAARNVCCLAGKCVLWDT